MIKFLRTVLQLTGLMVGLLGLAVAWRPAASSAVAAVRPGSGVETLELAGHVGGTVRAVFALDDLVLAGFGPEFTVFDRSDPANLIRLEYLMFEQTVSHIQANGSHAFVGVGDGVHVVDVSEPAAPTLVGFYQSPAAIHDMSLEGVHLYVAAGAAGLRVVDVSDPLLPVEVGFLSTTGAVTTVNASNDLAYIGDNGLRIIDVTNPATPVEIGYYPQGGVSELALGGNYAFLVHGDLTIVDISDPANPVLAGQYVAGGESPISQVAVRGNYVFLVKHGCPYGGDCLASFSSLDVSNPAAPVEHGTTFFYSHFMYGVSLAGDYAFIAANTAGLQIMDISQPAKPGGAGSYGQFWDLGGVQAMSTPHLFVGMSFYLWWYETDIQYKILDIADPHLPVVRGEMEGGGLYFTDDRYAYLHIGSRHTSHLYAMDMTDPLHPVGTGSWGPYKTFIGNLFLGDEYVYATGDYQSVALEKSSLAWIATHEEEMRVVYNQNGLTYANRGGDLYVYVPPFVEVNVVEDLAIDNLQVIGQYGYSTGYYLQIIDMVNPVEPVLVGSLELPLYGWGMQISGDYAYISTNGKGILIIDISDPAAPMQVMSYPMGYYPSFQLVGSYLYIADGANGIVVLDVSNPAAPVQVASYNRPNPSSLVVNGTHLYAAYGAEGVYAFKLYGLDRRFYVPLVMERPAAD